LGCGIVQLAQDRLFVAAASGTSKQCCKQAQLKLIAPLEHRSACESLGSHRSLAPTQAEFNLQGAF